MGNKKKILFVCQYFYPEIFRGNDVAFHWAEEGHDVHVVTHSELSGWGIP